MIPNPRARTFIALPATTGVLTRRVIAYVLDLLFIAIFMGLMAIAVSFLTVMSLGLLHGLWALVAVTPIIYCTVTIGGSHGATWGMRLMSIGYRREDGNLPTPAQAFIVTLLFYFSVYLTGTLILLVALITRQHRTLHDILSGLVMIRTYNPVWSV